MGAFFSYLLLAVLGQNILLDRAVGLEQMITAARYRPWLWRLTGLVGVCTVPGVMMAWLFSRLVTGRTAYVLLAALYLLLCGGVYFAADRLLLRFRPETHDRWAPILPHALINAAAVGTPLSVLTQGIPHWYGALGFGFGGALGLLLAVALVINGTDLLDSPGIPAAFRGTPALLIYIGILSLGFCAFF